MKLTDAEDASLKDRIRGLGFKGLGLLVYRFRVNPIFNLQYYSSFCFIFHYPNIFLMWLKASLE